MKKSLVVAGLVASTVALAAAPLVTSSLGMSAFAAEGETDAAVTAAIEKAQGLLKEINQKFPNLEKWGTVGSVMYTLENQYGCMGMGCAAQEAGLLNNDAIKTILTDHGVATDGMNSMERLEAVKKLSDYDTLKVNISRNEATPQYRPLKDIVPEIEAELDGLIYGHENDYGFNLVPNLPAEYSEKMKSLTPAQVVKEVRSIPGYTQYTELATLASQIGRLPDDTPANELTVEKINQLYDKASKALAAAEAFEASQKPSTPEVVETKNELKELVEKTKANPEYQKYEKLVRGVHDAEALLESLKKPVTVTPNARTARSENTGSPVIVLAVAREVAAETDAQDAATTAEIVATIKALGDAMRAVGNQTTLGEGLTTATVDDLAKAIEVARGVEKFNQYEELVEAIDAAEIAIANGVTDPAELKAILTTVQQVVKKVFPPDAGVAPVDNTEVSAVAGGFPTSAIVATLAATVGAAVILKRRFSNKAE